MVAAEDFGLFILVIVCLALAGFIFCFTLFGKLFYLRKHRRIEEVGSIFHDHLTSYLLCDEAEAQRAFAEIQQLARGKKNKRILIDQLIELSHNFSGRYNDEVFRLYEKMGLQRISLAKLKSQRWDLKVRAMYELSSLEYDAAFDEISKYINHKNGEVRRNARVSLIKVRKKEALMMLKDLEGNVSKWTIINILATLKRNPTKLTEEEIHVLKNAKNFHIRELAKELETIAYVQ